MANISGKITRTFYTCISKGFYCKGVKNGVPELVQIESDEYMTVNPNDRATAKRMIKKVNKGVILDTVEVAVIYEEVRAMDLADFYDNSVEVERDKNGRVK